MFLRGRILWTSVKIGGKWKNISLQTDDRRVAKKVEAELKLRLLADATGQASHVEIVARRITTPDMTVAEAFERFMKERPFRIGENQFKRDQASQRKLVPVFGHRQLVEVTQSMIHGYKMGRYEEGVGGATINREVDCLSAMFTMAKKDWGVVKDNPCHSIRREPENGRDRVLTDEEEACLMAAADPWMQELIVHALDSGMRESAIFALEKTDIDLFGKRIRIRGTTNKGGVTQVIPLTDRLYEQLKGIISRSESSTRFVYPNRFGDIRKGDGRFGKQWRTLCERAEVKDLWFHDLRRTFATRLYEGGIDIEKISKLLGHSNVAVTERYIKRKFNFLDDALDPLNARRRDLLPEVAEKKGK